MSGPVHRVLKNLDNEACRNVPLIATSPNMLYRETVSQGQHEVFSKNRK